MTNQVVQGCVSTQTFPYIELMLGVVSIETLNGEVAVEILLSESS